MRDHVLKRIAEFGERDDRVRLVSGDLGYKVLDDFIERCPGRYVNAGIAEQSMTALAAGMAIEGDVVFTYSIGNFPTLRCIEQIRNDVCYPCCKVIILAVGGGMVYGNQGITHHATEDIAMMRSLPNMRVYVPCDVEEAVACVEEAYRGEGPAYIRLARNKEEGLRRLKPVDSVSALAEARAVGSDVNVIACGTIATEAALLCESLSQRYSVGFFTAPRLKPFDGHGMQTIAARSRLVVTMEEHQVIGGLGSACAEVMAEMPHLRARLLRVGLQDEFSSEVGSQEHLRNRYGLTAEAVAPRVIKALGDER